MELKELPVEVLAKILSGFSSWTAIGLSKCGSRLLTYKLTHEGVIDLESSAHSGAKGLVGHSRDFTEIHQNLTILSLSAPQLPFDCLELLFKSIIFLDTHLTKLAYVALAQNPSILSNLKDLLVTDTILHAALTGSPQLTKIHLYYQVLWRQV